MIGKLPLRNLLTAGQSSLLPGVAAADALVDAGLDAVLASSRERQG